MLTGYYQNNFVFLFFFFFFLFQEKGRSVVYNLVLRAFSSGVRTVYARGSAILNSKKRLISGEVDFLFFTLPSLPQ